MAIATLHLDGDTTTQWDEIVPASPSTHFDKIDEGAIAANDGDFVATETVGDVDQYTVEATPSDVSSTVYFWVYIRGQIDDPAATAKLQVDLFHSGSTPLTGNPQYITGADFGGYGVLGMKALIWYDTLTKAQADSVEVRITPLAS